MTKLKIINSSMDEGWASIKEIKSALTIEIENSTHGHMGSQTHVVKLLWNGEVISEDSVELHE